MNERKYCENKYFESSEYLEPIMVKEYSIFEIKQKFILYILANNSAIFNEILQ